MVGVLVVVWADRPLRVMVTRGERSVQGGMVVQAGNRPVDVVPLGGREAARGHLPFGGEVIVPQFGDVAQRRVRP
jgi:hypothetical protein